MTDDEKEDVAEVVSDLLIDATEKYIDEQEKALVTQGNNVIQGNVNIGTNWRTCYGI